MSAARSVVERAAATATSSRVADRVAEAVVDGLEVVEVDEQNGHAGAFAQVAGHCMAHALVEQCPVGEVRDRVVERLVGELLLEGLALADVAPVEHDPADYAVAAQVRVQDLEMAQVALVVCQQAVDHLVAAGRAGAVVEAPQQATLLVGVQQPLERTADHLLDGVAEHALDRGALVEDDVVGTENRDQVAGVLHEHLREPRLARPPVNLRRELGAAKRQRNLVGECAQRVARLLVVGRFARQDQDQGGVRRTGGAQFELQNPLAIGGQLQLVASSGEQHRQATIATLVQQLGDLPRCLPLRQLAFVIERHRGDSLAGYAAHARIDPGGAEVGDCL